MPYYNLKPCPFCGEKAYVIRSADGWMAVKCTICTACVKIITNSDEQIVKLWNRRK